MDSALDYGISEFDFWNMTLAEIFRLVESKKRVKILEMQERATFDYKLSDLVGRSVARIYSSSATMPPIEQVYPQLFNSEKMQEEKQKEIDNLSAIRFKQFALSYNKRFREVQNSLNG